MNNVAGVLHKQRLNNIKKNLDPQDRQDIDNAISAKNALDVLNQQDDERNEKGADLYNQGKLTTKVASKLDKQDQLNHKTEDLLSTIQYPNRNNDGSLYNNNLKISWRSINNGSFQKDIARGIKAHMNPKYLGSYAQDDYVNADKDNKPSIKVDDFSAETLHQILHHASNNSFSKGAKSYFKVASHTPTPISFTQLSKIPRHKLSHQHSFSTKAKSLQSINHKKVAQRSVLSRGNNSRKVAMKRNQGMER